MEAFNKNIQTKSGFIKIWRIDRESMLKYDNIAYTMASSVLVYLRIAQVKKVLDKNVFCKSSCVRGADQVLPFLKGSFRRPQSAAFSADVCVRRMHFPQTSAAK